MKVNVNMEMAFDFGDIIYYKDGTVYMIGRTVNGKYVWVNLNNGMVGTVEYDSGTDLISKEFDNKFTRFKNSNVELNLK